MVIAQAGGSGAAVRWLWERSEEEGRESDKRAGPSSGRLAPEDPHAT